MRRTALLVALALALTACPPPPDPDAQANRGAAPGKVRPRDTGSANPVRNDAPASPRATDAPSAAEAEVLPRGPEGKDTPRRVEYLRPGGGVYVPHCPECGQVQPDAARVCEGCGQALTPWQMESDCGPCAATGRCQRCGDDRACRSCDGGGVCPFCRGTGKVGAEECAECHGGGKCADCGGDGFRERAARDFRPDETVLPGVCPTCIDGSGLCPECGSKGTDPAGKPCLSCAGTGVCHDCGGTGDCPHDGADGVCVVCRGSGREVRNGSPPPLAGKIWNVRLASGAVMTGVVTGKPEISLTVVVGRDPAKALMKSQVDPLSYFVVGRAWAENAQDHLQLSQFAETQALWPLVTRELETVRRLDPAKHDMVQALLGRAAERRSVDWFERADRLFKDGDRERALVLLAMLRLEAGDSGTGRQAKVLELRIEQQIRTEEESLDDAARTRRTETAAAEDAAAAARGARYVERAQRLLERVARETLDDATIEALFDRADAAALRAQRVVLVQAHRDPPSLGRWTAAPERLVAAARTLRAGIVAAHAQRAVAAGRFDQGARLAQRALHLDSNQATAQLTLKEAERGRARLAVQQGSPPPRK